MKKTFSVSLQEIPARLPKISFNMSGAFMVQHKKKIQKLSPEEKSWFQLETRNALQLELANKG